MQESDHIPAQKLLQDSGEIFFRNADIIRFQRVFDAVVDDGRHFLMTSEFDGVVDHYGKMMLNRIKMRSGLAVETFMPASTDALVNRFNELLDNLSVDEARGAVPSNTPGRIIVVNDPRAIDGESWPLLSRMINDFPGLNMRLVFLLDRIPSAVEKVLERFGSRLIRWEVNPPSSDEQLQLRKEGMQVGLEFQVERILSRINQTLSEHLEPSLYGEKAPSMQVDVAHALSEGTDAGEREAEDIRALFEDEPQKKSKKIGFRLIMTLGLVLGIGTGIAGFVSPEVGQQLDRILQAAGFKQTVFTRQNRGRSVVDAAYDASQSETPQPLQPEVSPMVSVPPLVPIDFPVVSDLSLSVGDLESSARTTLAVQIAQGESNLVVEQSSQNTENSAESIDQNLDETGSASPVGEEPVLAIEPENTDSYLNRIKDASPADQFIQHIVLASRARAMAWLATQSNLSRAVVVPIEVNSATRFAVVSGAFTNREETREYIQGLGAGADYWVRTAGSLQRILRDGD